MPLSWSSSRSIHSSVRWRQVSSSSAGITVVAGQTQIVGQKLSSGFFQGIANSGVAGINFTVLYMIVAAALIWAVS